MRSGLDLDDLARLDVHEARVHAEVAVEVDEGAEHDVARPDQLADLGARQGVHPARACRGSARRAASGCLTLDHAGCRILARARRSASPRCPFAGRRSSPCPGRRTRRCRTASRRSRAGCQTCAPGLPRRQRRARGVRRTDSHARTRAHIRSPSGQRVSFMPSCAASTSSGRPRRRACWRAAATSSSIGAVAVLGLVMKQDQPVHARVCGDRHGFLERRVPPAPVRSPAPPACTSRRGSAARRPSRTRRTRRASSRGVR